MNDVIAIGSTTLDTFWETDIQEIAWDAPSGRALVIPLGEKFAAQSVQNSIGGNAANAAVTFSRQGKRTSLYTCLGKDKTAKEILDRLKQERVGLKTLQISKKEKTAQSVILLKKGERSIFTHHGAINDFSLKGISKELLSAKWWYVSLPGKSYQQFNGLLAYAWKHQIKVALNPSSLHLVGAGRKELLKHLKKVSFLVVNQEEASRITGISFTEKKRVFRALDDLVPGIVAVTGGKSGSEISDGHYLYRAGTFPEKKVVDRTGAGDAFGSGFVAGLMHSKETCEKGPCNPDAVAYAVRLASANATSVVECVGGVQGILSKKDFETNRRWKKFDVKISRVAK